MKAFKYTLLTAAVSAQNSSLDEFDRQIDLITDRQRQFQEEKARNECDIRIKEALDEVDETSESDKINEVMIKRLKEEVKKERAANS